MGVLGFHLGFERGEIWDFWDFIWDSNQLQLGFVIQNANTVSNSPNSKGPPFGISQYLRHGIFWRTADPVSDPHFGAFLRIAVFQRYFDKIEGSKICFMHASEFPCI